MALSTRQKMFFFVGLNIALYGLALMIMGTWLLDKTAHGASGSAMWFGIILIMCGVGDVITSLDSDEKDNIGGFSMGALLANMIAMLVGIMVIGFATWGAYDFIDNGITYGSSGTEATIEIYVTVVLLGGFAMVLSTLALMYDCCCSEGFDMFGMSPQDQVLGNAGVYPQVPMGAYPQGYR